MPTIGEKGKAAETQRCRGGPAQRGAMPQRKAVGRKNPRQPASGGGVGWALSVEHTSTLYPGLLLPAVLPGHDLPSRGQLAQQQQEGAGRKRRPWTGAPASWGLDPNGGLCNAPLDLKY